MHTLGYFSSHLPNKPNSLYNVLISKRKQEVILNCDGINTVLNFFKDTIDFKIKRFNKIVFEGGGGELLQAKLQSIYCNVLC